jgi:nicotinamidase-related amidase
MPQVLPGETTRVSKTALIVVDMVNAYDHPDAEQLTQSVEKALPTIKELIDDSDLTIYVNDNFGHWHSNRDDLVKNAVEGDYGKLVEPIRPDDDAIFVVKARHSIFYQTPLEYLLQEHEVDRVVLIGQVTEQCILYSALDAYIRRFQVAVPRDAVAHIHEHLADAALELMEVNMDVELCTADDCRF